MRNHSQPVCEWLQDRKPAGMGGCLPNFHSTPYLGNTVKAFISYCYVPKLPKLQYSLWRRFWHSLPGKPMSQNWFSGTWLLVIYISEHWLKIPAGRIGELQNSYNTQPFYFVLRLIRTTTAFSSQTKGWIQLVASCLIKLKFAVITPSDKVRLFLVFCLDWATFAPVGILLWWQLVFC